MPGFFGGLSPYFFVGRPNVSRIFPALPRPEPDASRHNDDFFAGELLTFHSKSIIILIQRYSLPVRSSAFHLRRIRMSVRSCANMLRKHFAVFSSVCFSAAVFAAAPAEEFEALPVTDRHFAALRQEHPRLFLPGNFDTLTSAYRDSYWGRRFGNRMLHDAAGSGRRPSGEPVPARTHFRQSSE